MNRRTDPMLQPGSCETYEKLKYQKGSGRAAVSPWGRGSRVLACPFPGELLLSYVTRRYFRSIGMRLPSWHSGHLPQPDAFAVTQWL